MLNPRLIGALVPAATVLGMTFGLGLVWVGRKVRARILRDVPGYDENGYRIR